MTDISKRLYKEAIDKRKKLEELEKKRLEKEQNPVDDTWSCRKCGTHHKLTAAETMFGERRVQIYKCQSCGFTSSFEELQKYSPVINSLNYEGIIRYVGVVLFFVRLMFLVCMFNVGANIDELQRRRGDIDSTDNNIFTVLHENKTQQVCMYTSNYNIY
jgi:rubredoxin